MPNGVAMRAKVGALRDDELARAIMSDCPDAFEELYRRHVDAASRVAQAVIGNPQDAGDAVSEAFARILEAGRAGRLPDELAFRPYLLRCVRNAALDHLRRSRRARRLGLRRSEPPRSMDEPHVQAAAREENSLVYSAFRTLPERWQWALWLHAVEDMPARSAATVLQTSANNASQLASRARAALTTAYVQAHIDQRVPVGCEFAVKRLGAYVVNGERTAGASEVALHLEGCQACRERLSELDELGLSLLRGVATWSLPAGMAARLWDAHAMADDTVAAAGSGRATAQEFLSAGWPWHSTTVDAVVPRLNQELVHLIHALPVERLVATVAAGLLAVSLSASWGGDPVRPAAGVPSGAGVGQTEATTTESSSFPGMTFGLRPASPGSTAAPSSNAVPRRDGGLGAGFGSPDAAPPVALTDAAAPVAMLTDTALPDAVLTDSALLDAALPDATPPNPVPPVALPDIALSDAVLPDAALPDAPAPAPPVALPSTPLVDIARPFTLPTPALPDAASPNATARLSPLTGLLTTGLAIPAGSRPGGWP